MFRAIALCAVIAVPAVAMAAMPTPPATYVMKAGAGDMYEIQSSRMVMTSGNAKIREFATMMVRDHTKSTGDVKAAAMKDHVKAPVPMLNPMQRTMIANLGKVSGAARDTMYLAQQKAAHNQALAVQEEESVNGTTPALKMTAMKVVPVVKSHIQMLASM